MAENKTQITDAPVAAFLATVTPLVRAADAAVLVDLMTRLTGEPPAMYGPSIIGFGRCRYRTGASREGEMPLLCFAPRKAHLVLYGLGRATDLRLLGKYTSEGGCVYVKTLADVDLGVLEKLLKDALRSSSD